MKRIWITLLFLGSLAAQEAPKPPSVEQNTTEIKALLIKQNELLAQQNELLTQLLPPPKKHHKKIVVIINKIVPIIDHSGSIASIVSVFGVTL